MLNCRQASQLASRAMDEKLPFWKKISLKMHLLLCRSCSQFTQQLIFLRKVASYQQPPVAFHLTDEAKQRISVVLKDKQIDS